MPDQQTSATIEMDREQLPRSIFAELTHTRLTWAIAAVHGEAERLIALHDQLLQRIGPGDNLVYLGNFLGCGPDVAGTVHELLIFRRALMARQLDGTAGAIVYLRGGQEELWHKLLQMQFAPNPREIYDWMLKAGIGPTIAAYGSDIREGRLAANRGAFALSQWTNRLRRAMRDTDGHDQLISSVHRAAYTSNGTVLFVSAGLDPGRTLATQRDSFWWGHPLFETIAAPFEGFRRVIRGVDPKRQGPVVSDHWVSLDGGCGFGGPLVAACFDGSGELIDSIEA
jgi:serine/threonine protein phosphatase 1